MRINFELRPVSRGAASNHVRARRGVSLVSAAITCVLIGTAGCSSAPAPEPHGASEAQHEYLAQVHEEAAERYSGESEPLPPKRFRDCDQYLGSCWGESASEERLKLAEEHRRAAAGHRAAARALREAEASACEGVPELDRDISPFFHREAIVEVRPLMRGGAGDHANEELAGATVVLRAAPGMTAERLQRTVDCHLARNASLGHHVPEMSYCPLVPKGVRASVASVPNGFGVAITTDEPATAEEILRRARSLRSE